MPSWTDDALELWDDLVEEFGDRATFGDSIVDVIKNPIRSAFKMTGVGYGKQADTTIDMLRVDAQALGIYALNEDQPVTPRPVMTIDGARFELMDMDNDDTTQPSVRFNCKLLQ